jgi:hypothetical protein
MGRRNTCIETLCGSFVVERPSRAFVELSCDGTHLCLSIGRLCDGLQNEPDMGWLIVDAAKDWSRIYSGKQ